LFTRGEQRIEAHSCFHHVKCGGAGIHGCWFLLIDVYSTETSNLHANLVVWIFDGLGLSIDFFNALYTKLNLCKFFQINALGVSISIASMHLSSQSVRVLRLSIALFKSLTTESP